MKKALGTIFCAALTLLAAKASAYMMALNEQLDHAIYSRHDPKLIVAGHIAATDIRPRPPVVEDYPADVSFRFTVTTVILGQQTYKGQTLVIPATAFHWPAGLLAFREGVRCALVLRTDWGDKRDGYYLCSVVPLSKETLRTAKDGEDAKRILAAELLLELKNETSANRQRHLILQVSPILQKAESKALVPFLKSHDTWLRRAAIAGLTCATKETKYLTMAHQDIEQFIKTTGAFSTIKDLDGGRGDYVLYPLLFSHYSFLSVGWSREEDAGSASLPAALSSSGWQQGCARMGSLGAWCKAFVPDRHARGRQAPVRMLPRRGRKREEGDTRGFIESAGDHRGHNAHSQPQLARRGFLGGAAGTAPEDCRCLGQGRDPQRGGSSSSTRLFCQSRPSISTLIPEPMPSMATRSPAARRPCSMPMAAAMGKATAPVFPRRSKVA